MGGQACGAVEREVVTSGPLFVGDDEAGEGFDWAGEGIAAATLGDDFTATLVLLGGEVKAGAGGAFEVHDGVGEVKLAGAEVEVDVGESEDLVVPSLLSV